MMKRILLSLTVAMIAILAVVATVAAASPAPTAAPDQVRARTTIPRILGLTQAQVMDLRQDGLTLAQIAERQDVDAQRLIDALVAQWGARIDARVANGALTTAEAATLKAQLATRAKAMVNQAEPGGMGGAAVGAGPAGGSRGAGMGGTGTGTGTCDGTGPNGRMAP
jgi:hypothetical protein